MNRIDKFLRKLSREQRGRVTPAIAAIVADSLGGLDVKKLRGMDAAYRVRIGSMRITFVRTTGGNRITDIDFRNDHTY